MKANKNLILMTGLTLLALSISTLSSSVQAQNQNQTSSQLSHVQNQLSALTQKFRELVAKSGANITLPQSGNLIDHLRNLTQSSGFKTLSQLLPQLADIGINETNIKNLQKGSNDVPGLVQKFNTLINIVP
jgi:hypothetical protein